MFSFIHRIYESFESHFSSLYAFVFPLLFVTSTTLLSTNISHGFDRSFSWDANTEPDLAGYRIYYKTGEPGTPYNGTGAVEGSSPVQIPLANLNDPENPEYTLHGLSGTGTFYFAATAYDINDNESDFSNVLCFGSDCVFSDQGERESESSSGGCFIATAAFGSKFEKHVQLLRRFRDLYIMPRDIGRTFVQAYYRYSPPVADFIAGHDTLRMILRWSLLPLTGLSWIMLNLGIGPLLLILSLMGLAVWKSYEKIKRCRKTACE